MMKRMIALTSGVTGYVLGARAGRERYEQIRSMAMKVKANPTVQAGATKAADAAKEAAPVVKDKISHTASGAAEKVKPGPKLEDSAYPKG